MQYQAVQKRCQAFLDREDGCCDSHSKSEPHTCNNRIRVRVKSDGIGKIQHTTLHRLYVIGGTSKSPDTHLFKKEARTSQTTEWETEKYVYSYTMTNLP